MKRKPNEDEMKRFVRRNTSLINKKKTIDGKRTIGEFVKPPNAAGNFNPNMKKRFALVIDEIKKRVFIMVDEDFISEFIAQDKNGKWKNFYQMSFDHSNWHYVSPFSEWRKGSSFEVEGKGKIYKCDEKMVLAMKVAVQKRDMRLNV